MRPENIWSRAGRIHLELGEKITGGFDIGVDERICPEVKQELRHFVSWVEANYAIPVTLWVDFEYKHYLVSRERKRVGFLFHWADFSEYPVFNDSEDIPEIRLPVRTEHYSMEEILASFIEAVSCYFAWISNEMTDGYVPDENDVEDILQAYLRDREHSLDAV